MYTGKEHPREQEAVRTTIVGGRPPGSGKQLGDIPRGIEILIKKASVDSAFRSLLFQKRAVAAESIGLRLNDAEVAMLGAVPVEQLSMIISNARVEPQQRVAFMGYAAAVMLAALSATSIAGCDRTSPTDGIRPDAVPSTISAPPDTTTTTVRPSDQLTRGSRPDVPLISTSGGVRPDSPQAEAGK